MQRKERRHSGGKVQKEPSRDRCVAVMRREEEEGGREEEAEHDL